MIQAILLNMLIWAGSKLFEAIDVEVGEDDIVMSVKFYNKPLELMKLRHKDD